MFFVFDYVSLGRQCNYRVTSDVYSWNVFLKRGFSLAASSSDTCSAGRIFLVSGYPEVGQFPARRPRYGGVQPPANLLPRSQETQAIPLSKSKPLALHRKEANVADYVVSQTMFLLSTLLQAAIDSAGQRIPDERSEQRTASVQRPSLPEHEPSTHLSILRYLNRLIDLQVLTNRRMDR